MKGPPKPPPPYSPASLFNFGQPYIEVTDGDYQHPVHLETLDGGRLTLFTCDGDDITKADLE